MAHQHKNRKSFTRWAYAILAAVLLLAALISYLVLGALNQTPPGNTGTTGAIEIAYSAETQAVLLQLPYTLEGLPIAGSVTLRHPSDNTLDLKLRLKPDRNMRQQIKAVGLEKGIWKVRLFFTAGEESYYSEKAIQIE